MDFQSYARKQFHEINVLDLKENQINICFKSVLLQIDFANIKSEFSLNACRIV